VTDSPRAQSDIKDEGDPADGRTTTPETAPAAEPAPAPEPMLQPTPEPEQAGEAHEQPRALETNQTPPVSEVSDTSSSTITSASGKATETVTPPPLAALGFPEGEPQSLHPAHLRTQLIAHWITICVMSFGAFMILSSVTLAGKLHGMRFVVVPGLVAFGISLIALWGWRYQHLEHARTSFVISMAGCEIRRGVVWRRIITVPLSRIQHSDVTQGPLQRAFGLATLTLYTAGTEHAKIDLHGLAFETAMNIRQYLFERSEAHER
jgi:uncharacterized protein